MLATLFDSATCSRKGLCPALESHSLYYEKLVFIMGLNSSSFAWVAQVQHFGRLSDYSTLVFDNRGVGHSGTPRGPYSTSGMAEDAIVLLDYLGWTEKRELATRIPDRIASLTLVVTTPGGAPWSNFPPWKGALALARLTFTTDIEAKIPIILPMLYPPAWLEEPAEDYDDGRTNREVQIELYRQRILTTAPQHLIGALSQMWAALTHHRLRGISEAIPKVLIVTGDQDNLVSPRTSVHQEMYADAEFEQWENTGHGIHSQRPKNSTRVGESIQEDGAKMPVIDARTSGN
ncbi:alpha beta-hydrolase [Mycena haematopus]|nr:alpha beta-hydrolase [Mycena haematopus]